MGTRTGTGTAMGTGTITAVLGPTNTGKTHYAIERMLAYPTGVIGLPLRLLAREVYDRIVAVRGPSVVALVTGEERIVPERARYWVATTEAMPQGLGADFVAIDEIQLCADPERGHVFTDRLLNARGLQETLFLGAETMRAPIAALVPEARFMHRERLSTLAYAGSRKLARMPARSSIVGFSVDNLYAIAELMRRQKGGVAVVMGALSPRTRNAQVAMYQNGDVDYLVATDAIGMGLNLDVDHVAFSALSKFDGHRMRPLMPNELAQIAGRAGRGMRDGTFGVTGEAGALAPEVAEAITEHRFAPVQKLFWRRSDLPFSRLDRLIAALEAPPEGEARQWLTRAREADDLRALKLLSAEAEVAARATRPDAVRLLWDVCRIPDFRGISPGEHARLLARIFADLDERGQVSTDWFARQVRQIDKPQGDIDTLSKRLAYIRTWTYVAQRRGWLPDQDHWRGETRAVEDRLSDALHQALTQRFVDRRTSVLLRRLKQKERLVAEVTDTGEVKVEGQVLGRLDGFRFSQDKAATPDEARTLRSAALAALGPQYHLRAERLYKAPDTELDFTEQGGLMWGDAAVGKLVRGDEALKPRVQVFVDDEAGPEIADKVARRLQHFIDRKIATLFEPLIAMQRDEELTGLARGFGFRLIEAMGLVPRDEVAAEVRELDQEARGSLRRHGVRFGQFTIFMPALLKPAPTRLRLVLASLFAGADVFPESPPPGLVTVPAPEGIDDETWRLSGYRRAGSRAIRIDMLERLADLLRAQDSRAGFEATPDMLSITGLTLEQFADLMQGLGYRAERGERPRVRLPRSEKAENAQTAEKAEAGPEATAPAEPAPEPAPGASEPEATPTADGQPEPQPGAPGTSEVEATPDAEMAPKAEAEAAPAAPEHLPGAPGASDVEAQPEADTPPEPHPGAPGASEAEATPDADVEPETEVFYTFTWRGRGKPRGPAGARREGGRPEGKGRAKGAARKGGAGKGKHGKEGKPGKDQPRKFEAGPPRKRDRIDPDNPFAQALMGLKDKS